MSEHSNGKNNNSMFLTNLRRGFLALLLACSVWGYLSWDPLGADTTVMRYLQGLTYRSLAYLQDQGLDVYPDAAQEKITVVLATDKALNSLGHSWPPPYYFHADVLRDIGRYQPKAIFMDFLFSGERAGEGIEQLADEICELKKNGIPVFLASDDFQSKDGGVIAKLTTCGIVVDANKPRSDGAEDGVDGYYRLYSKYDWGNGISPALAMYAVDRSGALSAQKLEPWSSPMEVFWSGHPPKNSLTWMPDCRKQLQFNERLFGKNTCYYSQTLFLDQLFAEESNFPYKSELLRGKLVFYGANFTGAGDISLTPLHENMPGVYLHAMALDNLMSFGTDYKKAEGDAYADIRSVIFILIQLSLWFLIIGEDVGLFRKRAAKFFVLITMPVFFIELGIEISTWSSMALLVYSMVVVSWTCILICTIRYIRQWQISWITKGIFLLLALAVAIGYSIQELAVFDLSPQNWLETSFLIIAIGFFDDVLGFIKYINKYLLGFQYWCEKSFLN